MMSTPVRCARDLMGELSARGYMPDEDAPEFIRADRAFTVPDSPLGTVRVVIDDEVTVYAFAPNLVLVWSARFDSLAPLAAVTAVMDQAEAGVQSGFEA